MARISLSEIKKRWENGEIAVDPNAPEAEPLPPGFWDSAVTVGPYGSQSIPLPIDRDIVDWFRANGDRRLGQVNTVLRNYVEEQKRTA